MIFEKVRSILRSKGYVLYSRPYELNIVGVRSKQTLSNQFDDEIHVFYSISPLKWRYHVYKATTDPGTYWLRNPMYDQGTAILAQGQYVNAYQIGMHRGKYEALVQSAPVAVIRDYNRDAFLDFSNGTKQTGWFGINIHHASAQGTTKTVDRYSAGCQVFENINDFNEFMQLCRKHRDLYGNHFTYTLIDFRAMRRAAIRNTLFGAATLGFGIWAYTTYNYD